MYCPRNSNFVLIKFQDLDLSTARHITKICIFKVLLGLCINMNLGTLKIHAKSSDQKFCLSCWIAFKNSIELLLICFCTMLYAYNESKIISSTYTHILILKLKYLSKFVYFLFVFKESDKISNFFKIITVRL